MLDPTELSDQELIDTYNRLKPAMFAFVEDLDPTYTYEKQRVAALGQEVRARGYEPQYSGTPPTIWRSPDPDRPDITESLLPKASDA